MTLNEKLIFIHLEKWHSGKRQQGQLEEVDGQFSGNSGGGGGAPLILQGL